MSDESSAQRQCFPYLHAILQLCYYRALRNEGEELAATCEGQRDDEGAEDEHSRYQEQENLDDEESAQRPHKAVVKRGAHKSTRAMEVNTPLVSLSSAACFEGWMNLTRL